jgi:sugar phosphate permease
LKRIFYGWFICAACTLLIFISMGMVSNGFSVFMPFLMERYGLTNAQTSSLVTLRCLVVLFAMLTTGVYYDRLGMRLGTALAAGFAGVAYLCYSFGRSYALFGVGAAVSGLSYGFGSMIPASILMNRWFVRHRALALGICSAGSGVATIVLPGVFTWLVERLGLTAGFQAGCGMIFVGAALIFLVQREDPAQLGLTPLGAEDAPERVVQAETTQGGDWDMTRGVWVLMVLACLVMGGVGSPGFNHLTVLLSGEGFDAAHVALLFSVIGVTLTLGKILFGQVTDRAGGFRSTLLFGAVLLSGFALSCLSFLRSIPVSVVTGVAIGVGYPIATVGPSIWAGDLTAPVRFPVTVRRLQVCYALGSLLFSGMPGILADRFGSYIPAYGIFTVQIAVALVFVVISYRRMSRRAPVGNAARP